MRCQGKEPTLQTAIPNKITIINVDNDNNGNYIKYNNYNDGDDEGVKVPFRVTVRYLQFDVFTNAEIFLNYATSKCIYVHTSK